jgi:hypothetical protein
MAVVSDVALAADLMTRFAARTGLTSDRAERRYLWTDSFAVCNFLGLARITADDRYRELAARLIDRVHHVLGRHRGDDRRTGWLSGLADADAERHPTRGGLRIGKELPERAEEAPYDPELEWDRDGQYFHYLTKWMHALDLAAHELRDPRLHAWARELADASHRAFVRPAVHGRRMFWKMSLDLSRPLVPSMGQHDPLDGFVTALALEHADPSLGVAAEPDLGPALTDYASMIEDVDLTTTDPLGLGGLLTDAHRLARIGDRSIDALLDRLLESALLSLRVYPADRELRAPAERRLAFRELGLAIGLRAVAGIAGAIGAERSKTLALADVLVRYAPIGTEVRAFWSEARHRETRTWHAHQDINDVMLATALVPDGYLADWRER